MFSLTIIASLPCLGGGIGRRSGLKIHRLCGRAGSIPALGTKIPKKPWLNKSGLFFGCCLIIIQKQHEIAKHIQAIRNQAEQLLANAKAHIEQMILGQ